MNVKTKLAAALATLTLCAAAMAAEKPITIIVPFATGGPTDFIGRTLATTLGKYGVPAIVDNKTGAGGTVGAAYVATQKSDMHTLLLSHNGLAAAPALYRKAQPDFEEISQVASVPMVIVARKDLPANNAKELLAYLKQNGNKINLAHAGVGSASHLCGMLLQKAIETDLMPIAYTGTAPALTALIGGQVDLMCDQTTNTLAQAKAGNIKLLAGAGEKRLKMLPNVPTLAESGLAGFNFSVVHSLYAPLNTPYVEREKFNVVLKQVLADPQLLKTFAESGTEVVNAENFGVFKLTNWLTFEKDRLGKLIRAAAIYAD